MTQAEALYHLQEIDLHIARGVKRLHEIQTALGDDHPVVIAQKALTEARQTLSPLHARSKSLELEIQSNAAKIRATDEQLYSGRVRNPKELQDMQHEIHSLKKRNSELEDTLLETMVAVEGAEAALKTAEAQLQTATSDWNEAHEHLLKEQTDLKAEGQVLQSQREEALKAVSADSLKTYNALRPRKNNQPMALLVGDSCSVCRVEQTRAIVSEVRKEQSLVSCSSCGRILVYKG
jgi:hypothetical protein